MTRDPAPPPSPTVAAAPGMARVGAPPPPLPDPTPPSSLRRVFSGDRLSQKSGAPKRGSRYLASQPLRYARFIHCRRSAWTSSPHVLEETNARDYVNYFCGWFHAGWLQQDGHERPPRRRAEKVAPSPTTILRYTCNLFFKKRRGCQAVL